MFEITKAPQSLNAKKTVSTSFNGKKFGKTKVLAKSKAIDLKRKAKVSAKTEVEYAKASKAGGSKITVNKKTGKATCKKGPKGWHLQGECTS